MSVGIECQRMDAEAFKRPLLDPGYMPTFEERLALIAQQIIAYKGREEIIRSFVPMAEEMAKRFALPGETERYTYED